MLIIIFEMIQLGLKETKPHNWKPSDKVDILSFFFTW